MVGGRRTAPLAEAGRRPSTTGCRRAGVGAAGACHDTFSALSDMLVLSCKAAIAAMEGGDTSKRRHGWRLLKGAEISHKTKLTKLTAHLANGYDARQGAAPHYRHPARRHPYKISIP